MTFLLLVLAGFFLLGLVAILAPCILSSWISRWEEQPPDLGGQPGD